MSGGLGYCRVYLLQEVSILWYWQEIMHYLVWLEASFIPSKLSLRELNGEVLLFIHNHDHVPNLA